MYTTITQPILSNRTLLQTAFGNLLLSISDNSRTEIISQLMETENLKIISKEFKNSDELDLLIEQAVPFRGVQRYIVDCLLEVATELEIALDNDDFITEHTKSMSYTDSDLGYNIVTETQYSATYELYEQAYNILLFLTPIN
jgi:hypothetical protein